jgi:hypothetical protein
MTPKSKADSEDDFWNDDADRLNALCDAAHEAGVVVDVLGDEAHPKLNPNGSLAEDAK